jgi:hypothetical protein
MFLQVVEVNKKTIQFIGWNTTAKVLDSQLKLNIACFKALFFFLFNFIFINEFFYFWVFLFPVGYWRNLYNRKIIIIRIKVRLFIRVLLYHAQIQILFSWAHDNRLPSKSWKRTNFKLRKTLEFIIRVSLEFLLEFSTSHLLHLLITYWESLVFQHFEKNFYFAPRVTELQRVAQEVYDHLKKAVLITIDSCIVSFFMFNLNLGHF